LPFGESVLGAENVEGAGGAIPNADVAVHIRVVDEGALFRPRPARRPATGRQQDVHAGRDLNFVVECVRGKGQVGILDSRLADNQMTSETQSERSLILQQDELLRC